MIYYCDKFDCEISDREIFICAKESPHISNKEIPCRKCSYFIEINTKEKGKWLQNLKKLKEKSFKK